MWKTAGIQRNILRRECRVVGNIGSRRRLHCISQYGLPFKDVDDAEISGHYSKQGLKVAWTDYQTYLLEKLNERISGTQYELNDIQSLIFRTARQPSQAAIFNYASQAWNNHFFFQTISANNSKNEGNQSTELNAAIINVFSGMEILKEQLLSTAESIFGSGWVWLVSIEEEQGCTLRVLATYNAGAPFDLL